ATAARPAGCFPKLQEEYVGPPFSLQVSFTTVQGRVTAPSAFPQPAPGAAPSPRPLQGPAVQWHQGLGRRDVHAVQGTQSLTLAEARRGELRERAGTTVRSTARATTARWAAGRRCS